VAAAKTEAVVDDGAPGTRFYEDPYELKTGLREVAAWGLEDRMRVAEPALHTRLAAGASCLEEEAEEFAAALAALGRPEDGAELREIVDYVVNQRTSEKVYSNGIRDQGRGGARPSFFVSHANAQGAKLGEAEVFALRLYTTFAFRHLNNPLRDDNRYARGAPVPLPATTKWAASALRKLRAVNVEHDETVLWRGMRSRYVGEAFMRQGGTELAFMSTTTDLRVAVRYALSRHSLLLRIVAPSFMSLGADLRWLSAFQGEAEVLFPPLTFLQPTGRTDRVDAMDRNGRHVTFTIVEVIPYIA
jgi:hypothetical protein